MSSTSIKSFLALILAIALGTVFALYLQPHLLTYPVVPFTMSSKNLADWAALIFWPLTWILYGLGIGLTLIWLFAAFNARFVRATHVLSTQFWWWLAAIAYLIIGMGSFFGLSYFNGWLDGKLSSEPLLWMPVFVILDVVLLFWLPTAIATPRSMRYVPPFSRLVRRIYGG